MVSGCAGLEGKIDGAGVRILEQDFAPVRAAILRAEHATLGIRAVRMSEGSDEYDLGIARIDQDAADLPGVGETEEGPVFAGIDGFVHARAMGDVGAHVRLAGADVEGGRRGRRQRQRTDRAGRLAVEDRLPGAAGILGCPHSAVYGAEIEMAAIPGNPRHGEHPAPAEGADEAPLQRLKHRGIDRRLSAQRTQGAEDTQPSRNEQTASVAHRSSSVLS